MLQENQVDLNRWFQIHNSLELQGYFLGKSSTLAQIQMDVDYPESAVKIVCVDLRLQ